LKRACDRALVINQSRLTPKDTTKEEARTPPTVMPPFSRRAANGSSNLRRRNASGAEPNPFHPKLIGFQIVCLQCFHYFVLALCLQVNSVLYKTSTSLDRIFTDKYVKIWHTAGWPDAIAIMIAAVMG
jgi:Integral membrane protein S linking to the trans Golgi network